MQSRTFRISILAILVVLLAIAYWWSGRQRGPEPMQPLAAEAGIGTPPPLAQPVMPQPSAFSTEGLGGTPEQLAAREVAANATPAAAPPRTYTGPDGKAHAFQYRKPSLDPREKNREIRRKLLMDELAANPEVFARNYGLNMKEVRWIAEGSADFPESLLE